MGRGPSGAAGSWTTRGEKGQGSAPGSPEAPAADGASTPWATAQRRDEETVGSRITEPDEPPSDAVRPNAERGFRGARAGPRGRPLWGLSEEPCALPRRSQAGGPPPWFLFPNAESTTSVQKSINAPKPLRRSLPNSTSPGLPRHAISLETSVAAGLPLILGSAVSPLRGLCGQAAPATLSLPAPRGGLPRTGPSPPGDAAYRPGSSDLGTPGLQSPPGSPAWLRGTEASPGWVTMKLQGDRHEDTSTGLAPPSSHRAATGGQAGQGGTQGRLTAPGGWP